MARLVCHACGMDMVNRNLSTFLQKRDGKLYCPNPDCEEHDARAIKQIEEHLNKIKQEKNKS